MANLITHYFFCEELCPLLPQEMQVLIKNNLSAYHLGAVGPDFLYALRELKDKAARLANLLHRNQCFEVFSALLSATKTSGSEVQLAYVLGFLSHYVLDKTIHPLVYFMAEEVLPPLYPAPYQNNLHNLVESAADEWILIRMHQNPRTFNSLHCARAPRKIKLEIGALYQKVVAPLFQMSVSAKKISLSFTISNLFGVLWCDKYGRRKRAIMALEARFSEHRNLSALLRPTFGAEYFDLLNTKNRTYFAPRGTKNAVYDSFPQQYAHALEAATVALNQFWQARFLNVPLAKDDFLVNYEGVCGL